MSEQDPKVVAAGLSVSYAWVRVGDGDPEPAAITGKKPNRKATTLGCPDTFDVDDPESGCSIVIVGCNYATNPRYDQPFELEINSFEEELANCNGVELNREDAARRERAYRKAIKTRPHSYAGFGRINRDGAYLAVRTALQEDRRG